VRSVGRDVVEVSVCVLVCQESGLDGKMCLLRKEGLNYALHMYLYRKVNSAGFV